MRGHWRGSVIGGSLVVLALVACSGDDEDAKQATTGAGGASTSATTGTTGAGGASTGGGGDATTTATTGAGGGGSCLSSSLLAPLGKSRVLVGVSTNDAVAKQAPFDVRYLYLAGGLFDGAGPCASCAEGCDAGGESCDNANPNGCAWWGCWQWDQDPPGQYLRDFVAASKGAGQIPMVTYYEILHGSGVAEGAPEVTQAANDAAFMARYLADFRFVLQVLGGETAFLQIEPDFWGYAEQVGPDPHAIPAAVAKANPTDCAGQEDTIAGLGHCMIAMTRKYAPSVRVGLHGSSWGPGFDATGNSDPGLDVAAEAEKLGAFLVACGADQGDFVTVDASDRDAGYYESIGQDRWWDDTNASLPSFHQAFTWAKALAESVGKPIAWWQVPVGNMSQSNTTSHWKDNRVDYFFAHMDEVAAAHGALVAFGAGAGDQTDPSTDGGHLVEEANAYAAAGGQAACP